MTKPTLSGQQINHIIRLCELRPPGRRVPGHKAVARSVGCTTLQVRYHWLKHLRFRAAQRFAAINLEREIADAKANPASEPYLGGHWKTW